MSEKQKNTLSTKAVERLSRTRRRMVWSLSALLVVVLVAGTALMTVGSDMAAQPIMSGAAINIGIVFAGAVIVVGASITVFYAIWANRILDPLIAEANHLCDLELSEEGPQVHSESSAL